MSSDKPVKSNSRKAAKYKGAECLNCGHPLELTDKYCSNCSQLNSTKQLSLKDFFDEFFSSLFTYDSRLRYTLKDLLFKPGTITKNYVRGQRLKYANPFRFFLSVSIIYFILQGFTTSFDNDGELSAVRVDGEPLKTTTNLDSLINDKIKNQKDAQLVDSITNNIDSIISAKNEKNLNKKEKIKSPPTYLTQKELDTIRWDMRLVERFFEYRKFYKNTEIKDPAKALDSLKHSKSKLNLWIYSKNNAIKRVSDNPVGFINYLMNKVPFFLFFFAPVYALFFWLIYSKKKYNYMEHLIFIFHIFSFIFLMALIAFLPDLLFDDDIILSIGLTFIGPFYFYKALRNFYKQKRTITIFKFFVLNLVFFIASTITALFFFSISAAIY